MDTGGLGWCDNCVLEDTRSLSICIHSCLGLPLDLLLFPVNFLNVIFVSSLFSLWSSHLDFLVKFQERERTMDIAFLRLQSILVSE